MQNKKNYMNCLYFPSFLILITTLMSMQAYADSKSAEDVYRKAAPSVVKIIADTNLSKLQGSGVSLRNGAELIDESKPLSPANMKAKGSFIATNAHVVNNSKLILVESQAGKNYATIEFINSELDLAILKVPDEVIKEALVDDKNTVSVGSKVYAIGSPLGLTNSISDGIVSGIRKKLGVSLIQTTAPISSGNSGGGLFDVDGNLIGITTFKLVGGENLNFAIEVNLLKGLLDVNWLAEYLIDLGIVKNRDINTKSNIMVFMASTDNNGIPWKKSFIDSTAEDESLKLWEKNFTHKYEVFTRDNLIIASSQEDTISLLCVTADAFKNSKRYIIDLKNSKINGRPATITENYFKYDQGKSLHTIERSSGVLKIQPHDREPEITGSCEIAGKNKF